MGFLQNVAGFFSRNTTPKEVKLIEQKQDEEVGRLISPVFREIPPNSKAGKFLTEGFRSWAFIAISSIADEICTTPIELYRRTKEGWIEVVVHPALTLMKKPNNFQTKSEFLWLASIYWLAEGEAPVYLNSAKNPTEMVLLNPERLTIEFDNKNIIGGYKYRQSNGTETKIPAENVIMLKMPSLTSPFRGAGVMRYIAQTLDIDNFIEEYLKLFFFNDTTPGAVLETEQELNQTVIERIKLQFQNRHQGIRNSHKLSILEKGMKYHKISSNINELQLKELNDMIRDKVLAAFKVPKSVLGITEDVNRANAEASSYTFSKRSVLPKLRMIEEQINQFLIPKFGNSEGLEFEFENPVFEDKLVDAQVNALAVQNGWLTADEIRADMGLDPIEAEIVDEDEEPVETPEDEEPTKGKYAKPKETRVREKKRPDALVEIMKDILTEENPQPKKEYSSDELVKFNENKIMFLTFVEREFTENLDKNFRRQKRTLLKQIEGKAFTKGNSINLQLDLEKEALEMVKIASPSLYDAIVQESELAYALLGLQNRLTPTNDLVKSFVEKRALKLGKETTKTTQDAVDRIVKDWTEKGDESWTGLRATLTNYFEEEGTGTKARADMIARTELANATGFAQNEVYKDTGAVGKKWLTNPGACPICEAMNDQYGNGMTVGITDNFFEKGDTLPDGRENDFEAVDTPPLHPNCRCDIIPVYAESKGNKEALRRRFEALKEKITSDKEKEASLEHRATTLREQELKLIEKEQRIAEKEVETVKALKKVEKTKAKVEEELKEVETFKKKING